MKSCQGLTAGHAASGLLSNDVAATMLVVMPKPKATKWFVGFFVNGIAADFRVHSPKKLRMARIGDVEP